MCAILLRLSAMREPMLVVKDLTSSYGMARVLWQVNLELPAGVGVGITGRNGAGKSTLLRTIAGLHRQAVGQVRVLGRDVLGCQPYQVARLGVTFVREGSPVFGQLSVGENIALGSSLAQRRGLSTLALDEIWTIFPVLEQMSTRRAGLLSGGQRQMLALATALASRPTLLLLDEPSAGLAPEAAATAFAAIRRLTQLGVSILIAEQNRDWLIGVAESSYHLEAGRMSSAAVHV